MTDRIVIGIGSRRRGDDGAGLEVARRLGSPVAVAHESDPLGLIDLWADHADVVVVDAMRTGAPPGTTRTFDVAATPLPRTTFVTSHAVGVAEAVELARVLGSLPKQVTVIGIEVASLDAGSGLSAPVAAAVDRVVAELHHA